MPDIVICEVSNRYLFDPLFSNKDHAPIWINSFDIFKNFDWDNSKFDYIFILAEICWNDRLLSDFYGFELVKQLRIKKIVHPIFICSFAPLDCFQKLRSPVFQILRISFSHPFLALPLSTDIHQSVLPLKQLSKYQLEDIKYHFFDIQGLLDEYVHHIKNLALSKDFQKINYSLEQIADIIPAHQIETYNHIKSRFVFEKTDETTLSYELIRDFKKEVQGLLPNRFIDTVENTILYELSWRVLLVDDNQDLLDELYDSFLKNGIRCFTATTGEEAFNILTLDFKGQLVDPISKKSLHANSITVVISDLRFIDDKENWQHLQGYDIIDEIAKMPNFVSLFILTSKKGAILELIARMNHLRIHWYAKEDVLGEGTGKPFSLFCSKIKTEGDHVYNSVISIPQLSAWTNPWEEQKRKHPLRNYYKHHQLSPEYTKNEKMISQCALDFILQAELIKDKIIKDVEGVGFSMEFQGNIPDDPGDPQSMSHFYDKLIGRRIAIGLRLKRWPENEISDILKYKRLNHSASPDRGLFSTHLALSTNLEKEIPHGLLVEERAWVENDLGISLDSSDRIFFNIILKKLSPWQDVFRKKGFADNFVEDITISNKEQLYATIQQAYSIAKEYSMEDKFITDFQYISDKLSKPMQKMSFSNFLASLQT